MVLLTRKIEFSASHLYHNPNLSAEENRRIFGKCNNPHGHGHNYTLEVTVAGEPDPVTGMVLDLKELKEILEREVMQRMDHRHLNYEVPELAGQIPTCENIAQVIWELLEPKITQGDCTVCASTNHRIFSPIATGMARVEQGIEERTRNEKRCSQNRTWPPLPLRRVPSLTYGGSKRRRELPRFWEMQQSIWARP